MPPTVKVYAKAIAGTLIPLVGLAVALGFFDVDTGAAVTGAVAAIATGLGVERIPNAKPAPRGAHERKPPPPSA